MISYPYLVIESLEVKDSETGWYMEAIKKNGIKHTEFENKGYSKELVEVMIIYGYFTHRFRGTSNIYKRFVEEVLGYYANSTEAMRGIMVASNYIKTLQLKDTNLSMSTSNVKGTKYIEESRTFIICQLSDLFQRWKKEVYLPKIENRSIIKI